MFKCIDLVVQDVFQFTRSLLPDPQYLLLCPLIHLVEAFWLQQGDEITALLKATYQCKTRTGNKIIGCYVNMKGHSKI